MMTETHTNQDITLLRFLKHPIIRALRVAQCILAVIIFFTFALMPGDDTPSAFPPELLHIIGNVFLMGSMWVAFGDVFSLRRIFLGSLTLSVIAELSQSLTASRVTDPFDFASNILGLAIGYVICISCVYIFSKIIN